MANELGAPSKIASLNMSQLINVDTLARALESRSSLSYFKKGPAPQPPVIVAEEPSVSTQDVVPFTESLLQPSAELAPPQQTASLKLRPFGEAPLAPLVIEDSWAQELTVLFTSIRNDIFQSRDRLITLPKSRQALIERRIETIIRKFARLRGEKVSRGVTLADLVRDSYRPTGREKTTSQMALDGFIAEVALHNLLQIFLLKNLSLKGLREFNSSDLSSMNYAVHTFLSQKTQSFTHDRFSWAFARPSVYSWYSLSSQCLNECQTILGILDHQKHLQWTDEDLSTWFNYRASDWQIDHLDFAQDHQMARALWVFIEKTLGLDVVSPFLGQGFAKKIFMPCIEGSAILLEALEKLLHYTKDVASPSLHHSLYACETEPLETFYCETMILLKLLRHVPLAQALLNSNQNSPGLRLPHGVRLAQLPAAGALELHPQEQLTFENASQLQVQTYQGTASVIQHTDSFDISVVLDHPDRVRSAKWIKALAEQLPYWRSIISSTTNLNWGELHLQLAVQKTKDQGQVFYFSHRQLPDGGDGERMRRSLLNSCTLDYFFMDLPESIFGPYRFLYVFSKDTNKQRRDANRVRFGKWDGVNATLCTLEESSSTQWEVMERGWDQVFVRGAAPLVRHITNKFPKLFQVASVQQWSFDKPQVGSGVSAQSLFEKGQGTPLEIRRDGFHLNFSPLRTASPQEKLVVFPHNPSDLPWLSSVLNSSPVQFWIKMQLTQESSPLKQSDLRSIPIIDLSHVSPAAVQEQFQWIQRQRLSESALMEWGTHYRHFQGRPVSTTDEFFAIAGSRFMALAKKRNLTESALQKYRAFFEILDLDRVELNPEAVTQFYPEHLLLNLMQSPEARISFIGRELTSTPSSNWVLREASLFSQSPRDLIVIHTKQGPKIQLQIPHGMSQYILSQLRKLRDFTWGEATQLLRIPSDLELFTAQTSEITLMAHHYLHDIKVAERVLEEMLLDLFEIGPEDRQYLKC